MAILGPSQLPVVLKVDSNPLKFHAISELGHPNVLVEMTEPQFEQVLRSIGDFIAQYFYLEERFAFFNTIPLQSEYDIPSDAYWIRNVAWDPITTRIDDVFGAECLSLETLIKTPKGDVVARDLNVGDEILSFYNDDVIISNIEAKKFSGIKDCRTIFTKNGSVTASLDHRIMTNSGWKPLFSITYDDNIMVMQDCKFILEKVQKIEDVGSIETIDFTIPKTQNLIGGGIVTHNSFLFCLPGGTFLLTESGPKTCEECYEKLESDNEIKLLTPFGLRKPNMRWNDKKQPISLIRTEKGGIACTPNHPVNINNKWTIANRASPGSKLLTSGDRSVTIEDVATLSTEGTWSIDVPSGCYYAGVSDDELYLTH